MSKKFQILFFLLNAVVAIKAYNYRIVMEEGLSECVNRPASQSYKHYFDLSQFAMERIDDEKVMVTGNMRALQDFNGVWAMTTSTEHKENGVWTAGILQVSVPNVCQELVEKSRPWYQMYSSFDPKKCPPKTGTTTYFDNQIVDMTVNNTEIKIPIGNWRAFNSFVLMPMNTHNFCIMGEFEVFLIDD